MGQANGYAHRLIGDDLGHVGQAHSCGLFKLMGQ